ncbi:GntR family transcriptional regulator [Ktedonosporobacter rubrisoli]|nr:GntR family transcriptional regulator [Ktedonosporobacter rubrisoli]
MTEKVSWEEDRPLYEQVRQWLLAQVTSGRWSVHQMLPPEVILAAELGISRVTLRRAMKDLVQSGVFTRISGRGTFVARQFAPALEQNRAARPELASETSLVGVLVSSTNSLFISTILSHLEHAFYERGYRMLLASSHGSLSQQSQRLLQLADSGVAGIILYSGSFLHDETINTLKRRAVPLVLIDRYYPAIETHVVSSDHLHGAYIMTEHLLHLGYRRIGFLLNRPEIVTSTLARFEGYKAALKDYGIAFEEELVMRAQIREEPVRKYLQQAEKPAAVFACNDDQAIEFLHVLHTIGLKVPDDIALVGFDDIPLVSRLDPPLTTVAQNIHQIGEAAAQLLIDTIQEKVTAPKTILLPTDLIIRQSCGSKIQHK